ncbi:hypothetical protein [Verminephrobacter eiseniae]|uniref:hypothetical protein n=1 Tax=Verminephrobacter eiseniae TaxID=364317 RepID=UPI002238FF16|nr:hypothetical protein [Verminephrobacter eiseniae]
MTDQRKPAQTAWPALRVLAAKVLGRLETTTTIITALLPIPVLSLPCAALGATDPIGSGLAERSVAGGGYSADPGQTSPVRRSPAARGAAAPGRTAAPD